MPSRKLREFVMEAYYRNIKSDVIADVTGLDVRYIYGLVYKQGLREVRDIKQKDQAEDLARELGLDLAHLRAQVLAGSHQPGDNEAVEAEPVVSHREPVHQGGQPGGLAFFLGRGSE